MSGLFLNFFTVEIPFKTVDIEYLKYSDYSTKESLRSLRKEYSDFTFYRNGDKILLWPKIGGTSTKFNHYPIFTTQINLEDNAKVLSKILEESIISFSAQKGYKVFPNKYSGAWEIISPKNLLTNQIEGLQVNRIIHLSTHFFNKYNKLIFGFSLSTSLKNTFTWAKNDFVENGIDIGGLDYDDERIFANRKSIKRFLESRGVSSYYDSIIQTENSNSKCFAIIDSFYRWLDTNKNKIELPFGLKMLSISKRYLPFENNFFKSEILSKPQRYFYSNRKNTQGLRFYDQMVKTYQPYSLELYQNKKINIGIICPLEYQGETESFIQKVIFKLKEVFHFEKLHSHLAKISGNDINSYKDALYDSDLLNSQLIYVIVNEDHKKLIPNLSPYFLCKAKFIGNGIPTQDIQIETIRHNLNNVTMEQIALNSYAKLGGTGWTLEKEDKLKDELIIGIGSTISEEGKYILGIAQVFHNDGRYMTGDCSPLSTFDNYSKNLEEHLFKVLSPILNEVSKTGTFRLIFHLFKSASEEYEIKAINNLKDRLSEYNFEYALVHLAYGHNFRLYNDDGNKEINQGTYIQLSNNSALLHFVKHSDLPLKIDLDKRSTFTSLFYLSKQIYWFSHLSHRSYQPSKRTVTIMYPSLMAKMTEDLKKVEGWDFDRLKAVSNKLWFI